MLLFERASWEGERRVNRVLLGVGGFIVSFSSAIYRRYLQNHFVSVSSGRSLVLSCTLGSLERRCEEQATGPAGTKVVVPHIGNRNFCNCLLPFSLLPHLLPTNG